MRIRGMHCVCAMTLLLFLTAPAQDSSDPTRPSIGNLDLERRARDRGAARTQIYRGSQPVATPRIRR